jgi:deoxyribonuclease I
MQLMTDHPLRMSAPNRVPEREPRVSVELEPAKKRSRRRSPEVEGAMIAPGVWIRPQPGPGLPYVTVARNLGDPVPPHDPSWYRGLEGTALLKSMQQHQPRPAVLGYHDARDYLFRELANRDGWVECVYTGRKVQTEGIPLSSVMNTEHTFPISTGIENTIQVTDLHHLFPTDTNSNTKRSSNPFGEVVEVEWEDVSKLGLDAGGRLVFEPRDAHKGTVARAMAYLTMCGAKVPEESIETLIRWNERFPPNDAERRRNDGIALVQGNRNPFIDEPELVKRIWSRSS